MRITPLPAPGPGTPRLREALLAASFTPAGLLERLGPTAHAALARGEHVPALAALRGDEGPLAAAVRLFLLGRPVAWKVAGGALPLEAALDDGWLEREGDEVRATVDVRPYASGDVSDAWIVSDAGGVPAATGAAGRPADVVLGAGGASATLAALTPRTPVGRVLDLGTGSGVQALHAARHAAHVTATDTNPRALRMASLTLALSDAPPAALREGSLFEPVSDAPPYDLIVSNPPFVISPARSGAGLTYRDGGLAGDELCRALVRRSADHLAHGGLCQLLANWEQVEGEDWRERLAGWVPPGCDAWIVRREEQDVAEYAELWLRDAGLHRGDRAAYEEAYAAWLDEFAARRVRAVGFGWITLRASGSERPSVRVEDWPHAVEQPLGRAVTGYFDRLDFLRCRDDAALLSSRYVLADGVVQEQVGAPGAEDPEHIVLRQRHGMMRAGAMDTVSAGFAGSCDGTLLASAILDAIASLLGEDPVTLRAGAGTWLRPLVEQGFLLPAG
ncbi:methyltransferase [Streptomyces radicis]|uniref:Transferase n=1 Tax=Streptomyces radicis TaxID=1750517 RepID=A0A3A9WL07_9ACTN|nr:methyltransferase [Streptomyces radicis]RKN10144.1 transferase [Streptomyces radicis]RKN24486.1 transferase [Streptomyces radicis]